MLLVFSKSSVMMSSAMHTWLSPKTQADLQKLSARLIISKIKLMQLICFPKSFLNSLRMVKNYQKKRKNHSNKPLLLHSKTSSTTVCQFCDLRMRALVSIRTKLVNKSKKIGIRRLRTMELLKNLLTLVNRHDEINEVKTLKEQNYTLLKKRLIETMLYMIKTYPFCSISNQQAILIMNCLREDFDEEDLHYLKKFVLKELIDQKKFTFPS